jgi:phosphoserine phosphatase RsbU/P
MTPSTHLDDRVADRRRAGRGRRLACAEVWSGNGKASGLLEMPGLVAWVHSVPSGSGEGGGDVHHVSVCTSCTLSRIALADVSGHGQAVAAVGDQLRVLMHRYLTEDDQSGLMQDLNRAVQQDLEGVHYATMVAAGWNHVRGLIVLTNAGHPPPIRYRAARREWSWIEAEGDGERGRVSGVPLGLLAESSYSQAVIEPQSGDLMVLYSDGVSEASNGTGDELGRDGLIAIARRLDTSSAEVFGRALAGAVRLFRGTAESTDDETIIVLQRVPVAAAI